MRIEQQNGILDMLQQTGNIESKGSNLLFAEKAAVVKSKYSQNQTVLIKDSTYLNPALEKKEDIAEDMESGMALDAADRKNQMAVLSHTTSEEDYAKMQEEGFSLDETTGNTIVTVTDKIKMQIAKGGGDISCFGDDLSKAQLEEMTGSAALAGQLEQKLKEADLPVTEENVTECLKAYELAAGLSPLTEGGMKYMLDNQLSPTIKNFYKAAYVGSAGYAPAGVVNISGMQDQINNIIKEAGLPVNEQTVKDSGWLVANDIPLTADNLSYLTELKSYTGAESQEELLNAVVTALAEGRTPQDAMLLQGYDIKSRAEDAFTVIKNVSESDIQYLIDRGFELTIKNLKMAERQEKESEGDFAKSGQDRELTYVDRELKMLTAKRQLEEIRLAMTIEANYSLLKRGISIDTKPLEELVETLKNEENRYYANLLESQSVEASEENVSLFAETEQKLSAIKSVPAYVLGIPQADVTDIAGVYKNGIAMKAAMEKANQSYEPLMTAPRKDLGDSYEKAFQNVDDILADLNMEQNDANRRAVRILAYNEIEITKEAIEEMKAADKEVQRVFKNLTPRVVIEMLRKGENPLEMDFAKLNQVAEEVKKEWNDDGTERFSEFLWKLERNKEITEDERSTFIGVYRLLHQVEQTDGAAIGALVNQGAGITLKNLLTAVRSANKQKQMDFSVDDSFGEREQTSGYQNSITDQIMAGYMNHCVKDAKEALTPARLKALEKQNADWLEMTPEQLAEALQEIDTEDAGIPEAYAKEQLEGFKQCANTPEEVYQLLEQYDIPDSVKNILAMEEMMSNRNRLFQKLFAWDGQSAENVTLSDEEEVSLLDEIAAIKQQLLEDFGHAVSEPKEMAEAQEALGKLAENVMKTMIESDEVTSIDLKEAKLMRAQLSIQKKMAEKETYSVPVLVGDEVTNVTLKIVHGADKRGVVDIMLETKLAGKIAATFQAKENGISGMIAADNLQTKESIEEQKDKFMEIFSSTDGKITQDMVQTNISTAFVPNLDLNRFSNTTLNHNSEKAPETTDAYQVQTTRLYRLAESFIRMVKETYK